MSDILGRICFSNAAFRGLKRAWFHRWVLWPVGTALVVGLPLALAGTATDWEGLLIAGFLLTIPFQLWVTTLAATGLLLSVPRLVVVGMGLAAVYFGMPSLGRRLAEWADKNEAAESSESAGQIVQSQPVAARKPE